MLNTFNPETQVMILAEIAEISPAAAIAYMEAVQHAPPLLLEWYSREHRKLAGRARAEFRVLAAR